MADAKLRMMRCILSTLAIQEVSRGKISLHMLQYSKIRSTRKTGSNRDGAGQGYTSVGVLQPGKRRTSASRQILLFILVIQDPMGTKYEISSTRKLGLA